MFHLSTLSSCILSAGATLLLSQPLFAQAEPCGNVGGMPQSCDQNVNGRFLLGQTADTWPINFIAGGERNLRMEPNNAGAYFGPNWLLDMQGRMTVDIKFTVTLDITDSTGVLRDLNSRTCGRNTDNSDLITSLGINSINWGSEFPNFADFDSYYNSHGGDILAQFQITANSGQTVFRNLDARVSNLTFQQLVTPKTFYQGSFSTNRYTATVSESFAVPVAGSLSDVEFRLTPVARDVVHFTTGPLEIGMGEVLPGRKSYICRIFNYSARIDRMDARYYID